MDIPSLYGPYFVNVWRPRSSVSVARVQLRHQRYDMAKPMTVIVAHSSAQGLHFAPPAKVAQYFELAGEIVKDVHFDLTCRMEPIVYARDRLMMFAVVRGEA